ncbi:MULTISPECIES: sensor histidine kinase [Actinomadura]|uniref:histidine kinase n=1 Tax=Actinomadura yumaensis TaxID=111807 RepID=A0ABW2CWD5_9ACTN|nr:sensor histidine kinase [Actinomadura sp. J1-007]MWK33240.1 sensor histidine kinase [Actinomadura sp. J1-007]
MPFPISGVARRARRTPVWLADAAIAAVVAVVLAIMIHEATEPHSRPPDAQAYALAVLMALPLLVQRRRPVAAMLLASLGLFVYYTAGYPGISPTTVLAVPSYTAVVAGHLRWATGIYTMFFTLGYAIVVATEQTPALMALAEFLTHLSLAVAVVLLAEVVRSRRALAAETRERLRLAEDEHEREAARRVAEDRVRIARELHDTVAHSMATITVQAGSALHRLGDREDEVRPALAAIRTTSKEALRQMRSTLGVLRSSAEDGPGGPHGPDGPDGPDGLGGDRLGLGRLPALLDAVRAAGVPVELDVAGEAAPLAPPVDHAAYRIVQESLTNVLRHAGSGVSARVSLAYGDGAVELKITDDGRRSGDAGTAASWNGAARPGGGHGLNGMRERARAVGGSFTAGPGNGGFVVEARLPCGDPAPARTAGAGATGAAGAEGAGP